MGPSAFQIVYLFILVAVNSLVLFGIALLFIRTLWCLGANTTTIEGWEIERHETLVRRARALGGYLDGPDGTKVRIRKQEYPYDIGIYANFAQGMGGHVHKWLWPFAATPTSESGLDFPENGFEGLCKMILFLKTLERDHVQSDHPDRIWNFMASTRSGSAVSLDW